MNSLFMVFQINSQNPFLKSIYVWFDFNEKKIGNEIRPGEIYLTIKIKCRPLWTVLWQIFDFSRCLSDLFHQFELEKKLLLHNNNNQFNSCVGEACKKIFIVFNLIVIIALYVLYLFSFFFFIQKIISLLVAFTAFFYFETQLDLQKWVCSECFFILNISICLWMLRNK